jgi:hypothetical protein
MPDSVLIPQFAAMTNRRSLLAASVSAGAALVCAPALAVSPPERWGDDGRSGAPAGPVVDAALLDGYATRPPWQVAGVDYHVGIDRTRYPTDASLKPVGTATLPPGVTRDTSQAAYNHKQILVTADNVTLDGYDFSGGWMLNMGPCSGLTIINCRFCVGDTNAGPAGPNQMIWSTGNSLQNFTFKNNEVDGNCHPLFLKTNGATARGNEVLHFADTTGVSVGMVVGHGTAKRGSKMPEIDPNGQETRVTAIEPTSLTLNVGVTQAIASGESIVFGIAPAGGRAGISVWVTGTVRDEYNWYKNSYDMNWQENPGDTTTVSIHRFNVWENTSTGYKYFGGHGDYAQLFQFAGYGYSSVTFDFNTIKITDANCMTQPFSIMSAATNQAPALQVNLRYNTVAGKIRRSTNYALAVMDGSWIGALTASYNYIDPTCTWNSRPSEWCYCVVHGMSIQQGPYNPAPVAVGNINMLNGLIMPSVVTKRGH